MKNIDMRATNEETLVNLQLVRTKLVRYMHALFVGNTPIRHSNPPLSRYQD